MVKFQRKLNGNMSNCNEHLDFEDLCNQSNIKENTTRSYPIMDLSVVKEDINTPLYFCNPLHLYRHNVLAASSDPFLASHRNSMDVDSSVDSAPAETNQIFNNGQSGEDNPGFEQSPVKKSVNFNDDFTNESPNFSTNMCNHGPCNNSSRPNSPLHFVDCEDIFSCNHNGCCQIVRKLSLNDREEGILIKCDDHSGHSPRSSIDTTPIPRPHGGKFSLTCLSPVQLPKSSPPKTGHSLLNRTRSLRASDSSGSKFVRSFRSRLSDSLFDPGKPPIGSSRSMETLVVDSLAEKSSKCSNPRSSSLRHPNSHRHHERQPIRPDSAAAHSDTDLGKVTSRNLLDPDGSVGSVSSDQGLNVGRVGLWASSFEKLIEDPAGLHTFAEFLKTEYSHENIYFWTACERYKCISNPEERKKVAKQIFERHLCIGASEPVNVDSQARQMAEENLNEPDEMLFATAQKQIFTLMKLDCYTRFLKSSLYKECEARDMRDQSLPYPGDDTLDPDLRIAADDSFKLKKSKSDADERRRKSLLRWPRKDRSKSKDRGEADYRRRTNKLGPRNTSDSSSVRSDVTGSRTSINSSDFAMGRRAVSKESLTSGDVGSLSGAEGLTWCRVFLPDSSNSVLALRTGETVHQLLQRLLEKRGINFSAFNVYNVKNDKLVDLNKEGTILDRQEVRVEEQVLFRLDLPNRKTVCVKAKTNKIVAEVLKPILQKYGYKLDLMTVHKIGEATGVNLKASVKEMNGQIFSVQTKEELKEYMDPTRFRKRSTTLDEITNKVFEDLLKGKSQTGFDDLGVLDIDARSSKTDLSSSDQSSSLLGDLSRRNSLAPEKEGKSRKTSGRASMHDNSSLRGMIPTSDLNKLTNSKRRTPTLGNPSNTNQENDELYEGLKRAQRSRLDDQRGTEINFELPDFLKCDQSKDSTPHHLAEQLLAQLNSSFDGILPSHQEAHEYFSLAHPEVWDSYGHDGDSNMATSSLENTLIAPDLDETLHGGVPSSGPSSPLVEKRVFVPTTRGITPPLPPARGVTPPIPPPMVQAAARRVPSPSPFVSPPPPLPPKPKLGVPRGPPPRPPSRQLHILNLPTSNYSSASEEEGLHLMDPSVHLQRQSNDAYNISFV